MAPVGPWAQPKATRREGGRRAERPAGSYATPDTPCSRTASEGSMLTERDQTVPALRPELDDPNLFGSSNRSVPADRSPRRIATWAASGVAVPLAFFCTLFFRHRKKSVSAPWDGKFHSRAVVGASGLLTGNCFRQSCRVMPLAGGLSARPLHPFGSPGKAKLYPIGLHL